MGRANMNGPGQYEWAGQYELAGPIRIGLANMKGLGQYEWARVHFGQFGTVHLKAIASTNLNKENP